MSEGKLRPTSQRLVHLDILRGFALFGILLVNFQWFARPIQAIVIGADAGLDSLDLFVDLLIQVLAQGKFYALFSILFGAGFALMWDRAKRLDTPFWGLYLRRLVVLLLFGLGHLLLVWGGDILVVYSLCAFVMVLLFRKTPVRRLWKWALVFVIVPVGLVWLGSLSISATQFDPELHASVIGGLAEDETRARASIDQASTIIAEGSWRDNLDQRLRDARFTFGHFIFWVPPILGFFLLGRWLVATECLIRPAEHRMFFRRWRSRGLLVGLPLSLAGTALIHGGNPMFPSPGMALGVSLFSAGAILLALAYLSLVSLASDRLRWLAPAGQMALSNYLGQSLFWTWVMYGHGLGLGAVLPRWSHLLLALAFFAVQVVISHWWLARFRFGPAEWLWRSLSYARRQPMLREN